MATIIVENVPETLKEQLWEKVDFSTLQWIYWDGMDFCRYDEVILSNKEKQDIDEIEKQWNFVDSNQYLDKLLQK